MSDYFRDHWNRIAEDHYETWYRLEAFRQGRPTLDEVQLSEVGDVEGNDLLHLQCNAGVDTLSWARLGANIVGVDIADKSLGIARKLSEEWSHSDSRRDSRTNLCPICHLVHSDRKIESVAPATYISPMTPSKSADSVRRAARMYATNKEAAAALGIGSGTFATICQGHGVR